MSWILPLSILGAVVIYFMTPEERMALLRRCWAVLRQAWHEIVQRWSRSPADDDGTTRPRLALVTGAIVLLTASVFIRMRMGGAPADDPATLVSWGGSFGPRTTNGEWWRLVTAMFVHRGWIELLAMCAGFIQVACITERTVGRFAFLSVYLAGGALANLVCLSTSPVGVTVGASGAVVSVYGLLVATWTWALLRRAPVEIPRRTAKRLLPGVALFVLYALYAVVTGRLDRIAATAAGAYGAIAGFLLAKGAVDHKPALRRVAVVAADVAALVVLFSVPLRGMADVTPLIERVMRMEAGTTTTYDAQVARFRNRTVPATALAQLIDQTILPQLDAARHDVLALQRVPREQQPLVALALQYLRLRDESWRLRSDALRHSSMRLLQDAARKESEARDVLRQMADRNP